MAIIKTKDLVFEYIRRDEEGNVEGITQAVDHVNLNIKQGDKVVPHLWRGILQPCQPNGHIR